MRRKKRALKKRITTFLMLYFVFFTLYFTINTMSKYVGRISDDVPVIGIAKWEVSINSDDSSNDIALVAGNSTQEFKVNVISTSEVACKYSIIISNVPNDIKVSLDGGEENIPVENKVTFSNVGSFIANDTNTTHEHILKFDAPITANVVENAQMQLNVIFIQDEL